MKIVRAAKDNINRVVQVFKLVRSSGSSGTGLPVGGTIGQLIRKTSSAVNYASEWFTIVAATVGLGNVTDDAQLKRSAGDFQAFPQKITPAAGDSVLIEDGSDGNNKKRALVDSFLGGGGGGGIDYKNPIELDAAATITPADGDYYYCFDSGVPADYTLDLDLSSTPVDSLFSIRVDSFATKLITVDTSGEGGETFCPGSYSTEMALHNCEEIICLYDGTEVLIIGGQCIPETVTVNLFGDQTPSTSIWNTINFASVDGTDPFGMWDTGNHRFSPYRNGNWVMNSLLTCYEAAASTASFITAMAQDGSRAKQLGRANCPDPVGGKYAGAVTPPQIYLGGLLTTNTISIQLFPRASLKIWGAVDSEGARTWIQFVEEKTW